MQLLKQEDKDSPFFIGLEEVIGYWLLMLDGFQQGLDQVFFGLDLNGFARGLDKFF